MASNEQNQCFTVAVGAQLTISNCLTRHKVYEMQSVDEMDPTGQAVFGISRNFSKMKDFGLLQLEEKAFGLEMKTSHLMRKLGTFIANRNFTQIDANITIFTI